MECGREMKVIGKYKGGISKMKLKQGETERDRYNG